MSIRKPIFICWSVVLVVSLWNLKVDAQVSIRERVILNPSERYIIRRSSTLNVGPLFRPDSVLQGSKYLKIVGVNTDTALDVATYFRITASVPTSIPDPVTYYLTDDPVGFSNVLWSKSVSNDGAPHLFDTLFTQHVDIPYLLGYDIKTSRSYIDRYPDSVVVSSKGDTARVYTNGVTGYPGIETFSSVVQITAPAPCLLIKRYSQGDTTWKTKIYDHTKSNIGTLGCALSSAAMALTAMGDSVNPGDLNVWMKSKTSKDVTSGGYFVQKLKNGTFDSSNVSWYVIDQHSGGLVTQDYNWKEFFKDTTKTTLDSSSITAPSELDSTLANCGLAIVQVNNPHRNDHYPHTHWVLVYSKIGNRYRISDPGPRNEKFLDAYGAFWSSVLVTKTGS